MGVGPCPCKYRLGISGNKANATVVVTDPQGNETSYNGTANFSAVQCFTGAKKCNPAVNNFNFTFQQKKIKAPNVTINFTQGRRGTISCLDNTAAFMTAGTAMATGNLLSGNFTVDFSYSINTMTNMTTIDFQAIAADGTTVSTMFTGPVSSQTFIGACNEKP